MAYVLRLLNKFLGYFLLKLVIVNSSYTQYLRENIEFFLDKRAVRDDRAQSKYLGADRGAASVTVEAIEDIIRDLDLGNKKILEIGPKFGFHTLWIDNNLFPSKLILSELSSKEGLYEKYEPEIKAPHDMYWGDILRSDLAEKENDFDVIFNLGVIYHCVEVPKLLVVLNKIARQNAIMFVQTTIDTSPGANIRLGYSDKPGGRTFPSEDALLIMLAQSGWKKITKYENYRKNRPFLLLKCEKVTAPEEVYEGVEYAGSSVVL